MHERLIDTQSRQADRQSAIWYAWGRNDAERTRTDVFAFGEFYVAQRSTRGQSVQDAYKEFTGLTRLQAADLTASRQALADLEAQS